MKKLLIILSFLASPALAQQDPVLALRDASQQIAAATANLADTGLAEDRVAALTTSIRTLENGLAALRLALRASVAEEAEKRRKLAGNQVELGKLLATISALQNTPSTLTMLHPDGASASARAGIILAAITPELRERADRLRSELATIAALKDLHNSTLANLQTALESLQSARNQLSVAVREDRPAPAEPTANLAQMVRASEDLSALSARLGAQVPSAAPRPAQALESQRGRMSLPVSGTVIHTFNAVGPAGIRKPGIVLSAPALSLVQAPLSGIVRFAGDFLEYGQIVILEPAPQHLQIYAGFGQVYVNTGDVLVSGAAMGLLGGEMPDSAEFLAESGGENDKGTESLYIEIRENGIPVDPLAWFASN